MYSSAEQLRLQNTKGVTNTMFKKMEFDEAVWQEALNQCVPAKFIEMNRKAFALGREAM